MSRTSLLRASATVAYGASFVPPKIYSAANVVTRRRSNPHHLQSSLGRPAGGGWPGKSSFSEGDHPARWRARCRERHTDEVHQRDAWLHLSTDRHQRSPDDAGDGEDQG